MCDYSLQNVRSRPAKVGDKLTTRDFGTVTRGFAAAEDVGVAVCVLPGTELAFANAVAVARPRFIGWKVEKLGHTTAIFRQVNKNEPMQHHDALEFPDGRIVLLTTLSEGQEATVLQLPAQPKTAAEARCPEARRPSRLTVWDRTALCRLPHTAACFFMRGSSRSPKCEREVKMHDMCGVHYLGALLLSQLAGLPMSAIGT